MRLKTLMMVLIQECPRPESRDVHHHGIMSRDMAICHLDLLILARRANRPPVVPHPHRVPRPNRAPCPR